MLMISVELLRMLTFLTSTPDVPSNTCTTARLPETVLTCISSILNRKAHTSGLQNLTTPLRAIGQRERHDLVETGEFDLYPCRQRSVFLGPMLAGFVRTFSKITSGPLTPPIVL